MQEKHFSSCSFSSSCCCHILYPDGVAWDCTTSKLYWTDVGDHDIEVLDPATGNRTVLIDTGEDSKPRAIILDCEHRFDFGASFIDQMTMLNSQICIN